MDSDRSSKDNRFSPSLSAPFLHEVKNHRELLNQLFKQQSHLAGGIDGTAFLQHLARNVAPVVTSVAHVMPECAGQTLVQVYELSLSLMGQRIIGPDSQNRLVILTWRELLPKLAKLIARDAANVVGSVTNVVYNMNRQTGVKTEWWLDEMVSLAPGLESAKQLFECAQVIAWRAGLVQFRSAAIETARTMEPSLARAALGLSDEIEPARLADLLDCLLQDRWFDLESTSEAKPISDRSLQIVGREGGFRGFEGRFIHPPCLRLQNGSIIAADADSSWQILADRYGSLVHRFGTGFGDSWQSKKPSDKKVLIDEKGNVKWKGLTGSFPELSSAASWDADDQTLAVSLVDSHRVYLVAAI